MNEMTFLKNLDFIRTGGSKEELKAAEFIQAELQKLGLKAKIEDFPVHASTISKAELEVTKPYKKSIPCTGYMNSVSATLTKDMYYLRNKNDERDLKNIKDKIVFLDGGLPYWTYKSLIENGAAGFITCNGNLHDDDTDIDCKEIREPLEKLGQLPGVNIHIKDGYPMIQNHAETVKLTLKQTPIKDAKSRNVVCKIKGQDDEIIVFSAHYDSVPLSHGIYDNETGALTIYKLAEYFASHKPKHTLVFVWCGSEEIGLMGSWAYCKHHTEELKSIILNINFDMTGVLMAKNMVFGSCDKGIIDYAVFKGKLHGIHFDSKMGYMPSDCTSFALNDVPAMSFGTDSPRGGAEIHSRRDTMDVMDKDELEIIVTFCCAFANDVVNAAINPVPSEIPEDITKTKEDTKKKFGLY